VQDQERLVADPHSAFSPVRCDAHAGVLGNAYHAVRR
jgi:hypothetical protein